MSEIEDLKKIEHSHARKLLAEAKKRDARRDLVQIRIDRQTIKLVPREKAIRQGLITE